MISSSSQSSSSSSSSSCTSGTTATTSSSSSCISPTNINCRLKDGIRRRPQHQQQHGHNMVHEGGARRGAKSNNNSVIGANENLSTMTRGGVMSQSPSFDQWGHPHERRRLPPTPHAQLPQPQAQLPQPQAHLPQQPTHYMTQAQPYINVNQSQPSGHVSPNPNTGHHRMLPQQPIIVTGTYHNYQLPPTPHMFNGGTTATTAQLPQQPMQGQQQLPQQPMQAQQQLPQQPTQAQQQQQLYMEQQQRRGSGRRLPVTPAAMEMTTAPCVIAATPTTCHLPPSPYLPVADPPSPYQPVQSIAVPSPDYSQRSISPRPSITVDMIPSPNSPQQPPQIMSNYAMNNNLNRFPPTPLLDGYGGYNFGGMNQSVSGYTLTAQQTQNLHNNLQTTPVNSASQQNGRMAGGSDRALFNTERPTAQLPSSTSTSSVALHTAANKLNAMCADTIARVRKMSADPRMFTNAIQNIIHTQTVAGSTANDEHSAESNSYTSQPSIDSPENAFDYDSEMIDRLLSPDFDIDTICPTKAVVTKAAVTVTCQKACGVGCIYINMTYVMARRRLVVTLVRCDGIPTGPKGVAELVLTARLQLIPGRFMQFESKPAQANNRQVIFNETYTIEDCEKEDIVRGSLHVELSYEDIKKKEQLLGSTDIPLTHVPNIRIRQESKLREELIPKFAKKLGKLQITTCLQTSSKSLTVNVIRVDDLAKSMFTNNAPDPLVRMTLEQGNRSQTKQTRTLKHSCSAVYKEAIMFVIDVGKQQLQDASLTIAIHDASRTSSGADLIGCCFLGKDAIDKSEFDQWKQTTHSTGREHKAIHNLKPPQPTKRPEPPENEMIFEESDIDDDDYGNVQTPQPRGGYDPMAFEAE